MQRGRGRSQTLLTVWIQLHLFDESRDCSGRGGGGGVGRGTTTKQPNSGMFPFLLCFEFVCLLVYLCVGVVGLVRKNKNKNQNDSDMELSVEFGINWLISAPPLTFLTPLSVTFAYLIGLYWTQGYSGRSAGRGSGRRLEGFRNCIKWKQNRTQSYWA